MKKLSKEQKNQRKRILEISYEANASHLGSCLSAVDIINAIYETKALEDRFVLSAGHAAVALYVILEKHNLLKNPNLQNLHFHPDRNPQKGIYVSTGSLGQGLPIAIGIAISNRKRTVYCVLSDGECAEGSIWEAIRIAAEQKLDNLKIIVNANGYGAYGEIDTQLLMPRFKTFGCAVFKVNGHNLKDLKKKLETYPHGKPLILLAKTNSAQFSFLDGQDAHYKILNDQEYQKALKELE